MDAPQSRAEILPIVRELQHLDPLLDIRWNPACLLIEAPRFTVTGGTTPGRYDGRWEVVRAKSASWRNAGEPLSDDFVAVIYQVRDEQGHYKPVGPWLAEYLRKWDTQQAHFRDELAKLRREEEREEEAFMAVDEGAVEHAVHQLAFASKHEGGRSVFFGQGADFGGVGQMERRARAAIAPPNGEPALIPGRTP